RIQPAVCWLGLFLLQRAARHHPGAAHLGLHRERRRLPGRDRHPPQLRIGASEIRLQPPAGYAGRSSADRMAAKEGKIRRRKSPTAIAWLSALAGALGGVASRSRAKSVPSGLRLSGSKGPSPTTWSTWGQLPHAARRSGSGPPAKWAR